MTKRISFRVYGDVQGVGFRYSPKASAACLLLTSLRYFTRKQATSYGVTGWVRNAPNNEVEGEAQGDDDILQKFISDINKGPSHATVIKVDNSDIEVKDGESGFHVKR